LKTKISTHSIFKTKKTGNSNSLFIDVLSGHKRTLAPVTGVQIDNHPMMIEARKFLIEGFYQ
jgi:peroxiredoxin